MTTERTRRQAADLHALANRLTAELDAALDLARACRPGIPSSFGGGSRSVGRHADPTGETAFTNVWKGDPKNPDRRPPAETDQMYARLTAALARLEQAITSVNIQLDRCKTVRTERQEANDLDAANSTAGICYLCDKAGVPDPHVHKGIRGDRLRHVETGERDPRTGDLIRPKLGEACRKAWERRPYSEVGDGTLMGWDEFEAYRLEHLRRTVTHVA